MANSHAVAVGSSGAGCAVGVARQTLRAVDEKATADTGHLVLAASGGDVWCSAFAHGLEVVRGRVGGDVQAELLTRHVRPAVVEAQPRCVRR